MKAVLNLLKSMLLSIPRGDIEWFIDVEKISPKNSSVFNFKLSQQLIYVWVPGEFNGFWIVFEHIWSNDINSCIVDVDGVQFLHEACYIYAIVGKNPGLVKHKVIKCKTNIPLPYLLTLVSLGIKYKTVKIVSTLLLLLPLLMEKGGMCFS